MPRPLRGGRGLSPRRGCLRRDLDFILCQQSRSTSVALPSDASDDVAVDVDRVNDPRESAHTRTWGTRKFRVGHACGAGSFASSTRFFGRTALSCSTTRISSGLSASPPHPPVRLATVKPCPLWRAQSPSCFCVARSWSPWVLGPFFPRCPWGTRGPPIVLLCSRLWSDLPGRVRVSLRTCGPRVRGGLLPAAHAQIRGSVPAGWFSPNRDFLGGALSCPFTMYNASHV